MFFLRLAVFVLLVLVAVFVFTQIIGPMVNNRPLFPFFRKEVNALQEELAELNEKEVVVDLKETVAQKKAALEEREAKLSPVASETPVAEAPVVTPEQPKQ